MTHVPKCCQTLSPKQSYNSFVLQPPTILALTQSKFSEPNLAPKGRYAKPKPKEKHIPLFTTAHAVTPIGIARHSPPVNTDAVHSKRSEKSNLQCQVTSITCSLSFYNTSYELFNGRNSCRRTGKHAYAKRMYTRERP